MDRVSDTRTAFSRHNTQWRAFCGPQMDRKQEVSTDTPLRSLLVLAVKTSAAGRVVTRSVGLFGGCLWICGSPPNINSSTCRWIVSLSEVVARSGLTLALIFPTTIYCAESIAEERKRMARESRFSFQLVWCQFGRQLNPSWPTDSYICRFTVHNFIGKGVVN